MDGPFTDEELDQIRNYIFHNAKPPSFIVTMERWVRTIDQHYVRKDQ